MEFKPSYSDQLYSDIQPSYTDSLMHHGIKGMHWGVRRYQNPDGSLTPAGIKRYGVTEKSSKRKLKKAFKNSKYTNRKAAEEKIESIISKDPEVQKTRNALRKNQRALYGQYADIYNSYAKKHGVKPIDRNKFNFLKDYMDLDNDIDSMVWDNHKDPRYKKIEDLTKKHEKMAKKLEDRRTSIANKHLDLYNKALLKDIPNDGSKAATDAIIKRYGNPDHFDIDWSSQNNPDAIDWSYTMPDPWDL